jgi:hypothetical protein
MKHIHTFESFLNEDRVYGMFNDAQGKPSKLSQEILDICIKGLPKEVTDNIAEVEASGYSKTSMVSPPSISNKGQSHGINDYTSIVLIFKNPMGHNKVKGMTVGLRKRTSGPGTGYIAIKLEGVPTEHAIEYYSESPDYAIGKLYKDTIKPLM